MSDRPAAHPKSRARVRIVVRVAGAADATAEVTGEDEEPKFAPPQLGAVLTVAPRWANGIGGFGFTQTNRKDPP
jgi:hypothetical protein